jgi:hypothetical protein
MRRTVKLSSRLTRRETSNSTNLYRVAGLLQQFVRPWSFLDSIFDRYIWPDCYGSILGQFEGLWLELGIECQLGERFGDVNLCPLDRDGGDALERQFGLGVEPDAD